MKKLLIAALALSVSPAFASMLIVGVDDATQPLRGYDTNDLNAAPVEINIGFQAWGLAGDNANQVLFANDGSTLRAFNYGTWDQIGTDILIVDANNTALSFVGLGFNPVNGKLYGTRNIANEAVYEINTTTGVATVAYDYDDGSYDFGGFDFDENGVAYGTNDDTTPFGSGLYSMDLINDPTLLSAYPTGETDIDGLAIGGGFAYLIEDDATATGSIYVYDLVNNVYTTSIPTPWATSEVFSSGAVINVVPEPATMTILGLGALALIRKRKSK